MRKRLFLVALWLCSTMMVACGEKEHLEKDIQKLPTEGKKENSNEVVKELVWYDVLGDDNILWEENIMTSWWTYEPGPGKVGYYDTSDEIIQGRTKTKGEQLLPIRVTERTGKTTLEIYTEYIKPLDVKTEFFGLLEDDIMEQLKELELYERRISKNQCRDNPDYVMQNSMMIFITSDKFCELIQKGCPEDMEIIFTWMQEDSYSSFEKKIEYKKQSMFYSMYGEDYFDREFIFYDGDMDLEYELIDSGNNVSWTTSLQEMFDNAKEMCDNSKTAADIYEQMKYVVNVSIRTTKGLDYVCEKFLYGFDVNVDEDSVSYEDGMFTCLAYMSEKQIKALNCREIFDEPVVLEVAVRPERLCVEIGQGVYATNLHNMYETFNDNMFPTFYVDETTEEVVRGYMTETELMDRGQKGKDTYWDWQLMYEQLWIGEHQDVYENADYFNPNLIWFLDAEEIGMPNGGQIIEAPNEGVHISTYMYKMFEYARNKYDDATTEHNEYEDMKYAMDVGVYSGYATSYVYDNYIKKLGVETQFDNMTDDEAKRWLSEMYPTKGGKSLINFKIYVTEEEALSIKGFGESVTVMPAEKEEQFEVTPKYMDIYDYDLIPVTYLDEETNTMKREYLPKQEVENLLKEKYVYWDWELMDEQIKGK